MGWIAGWPRDDGPTFGDLVPYAVTLHRTYGHWPGDYSVGKNQGLFQFLIGQDSGQYVQFASTERVCYHANGANFRSFGVELTGTNDDPLTDWQIAKLGDVLSYAHSFHGIPLVYQDPIATPPASISVNHSSFVGVISHVSVATDDGTPQHDDLVTVADFQKAAGVSPAPTPVPPVPGADMDLYFGQVDTATAIGGTIPVPAHTPLAFVVTAGGRIVATWADTNTVYGVPKGAADWRAAGRSSVAIVPLDPAQMAGVVSADAKTR